MTSQRVGWSTAACSMIVLFACVPAVRAEAEDSPMLSFSRVSLRQSFQSSKGRAEPADIGFSTAAGSSNAYTVGAALGYNLVPDAWAAHVEELSPFVEIQKNTAQTKPQDVLLAGVALNTTLLNVVEHLWTPIIDGKINFKRDRVGGTRGMQGALLFTPFIARGVLGGRPKKAQQVWFLPNNPTKILGTSSADPRLNLFWFEYNPYVGFEYEGAYRATKELSTGTAVRFLARLKLSFDVAPDYWQAVPVISGIQLVGDGYVRQDITDSIEKKDDTHPLGKVSLNLDIFKQEGEQEGTIVRSAGIGLDYLIGEDPANGFEEQQVLRVTFKVKL